MLFCEVITLLMLRARKKLLSLVTFFAAAKKVTPAPGRGNANRPTRIQVSRRKQRAPPPRGGAKQIDRDENKFHEESSQQPRPGKGHADRRKRENEETKLKPLPETNNVINAIPKPLIKGQEIPPSRKNLQINLRTSSTRKRRFRMKHQRAPEPAPPLGSRNSERINPPAMPVIPAHHSPDDIPIERSDKEQLRLRAQFISNGQRRIALRPRCIRVLWKHIAPQIDHGIAIARIERADDHSESRTERSIDII